VAHSGRVCTIDIDVYGMEIPCSVTRLKGSSFQDFHGQGGGVEKCCPIEKGVHH
jgi:hypothetical protein